MPIAISKRTITTTIAMPAPQPGAPPNAISNSSLVFYSKASWTLHTMELKGNLLQALLNYTHLIYHDLPLLKLYILNFIIFLQD